MITGKQRSNYRPNSKTKFYNNGTSRITGSNYDHDLGGYHSRSINNYDSTRSLYDTARSSYSSVPRSSSSSYDFEPPSARSGTFDLGHSTRSTYSVHIPSLPNPIHPSHSTSSQHFGAGRNSSSAGHHSNVHHNDTPQHQRVSHSSSHHHQHSLINSSPSSTSSSYRDSKPPATSSSSFTIATTIKDSWMNESEDLIDDDSQWLKEVTRCNHFERDHYCKELTNCPFFHEGIDCIRFFTRRPCTGNKCKFKHRVILADGHDKDMKRKHTEKDDNRGKEVQKEAEKSRAIDRIREQDIHRDKTFYSKSKPSDAKKRTHSDHSENKDNTEVSHEHTKRTKRMYEDGTREEATKEGDKRILRRSSGGLEITLPPSWKAAWSKQGDIYYYNTVTGVRTWNLPSDKLLKDNTERGGDTKPKDKHSHKERRGKGDKEGKSHKHKEPGRHTEERKAGIPKEPATDSEKKVDMEDPQAKHGGTPPVSESVDVIETDTAVTHNITQPESGATPGRPPAVDENSDYEDEIPPPKTIAPPRLRPDTARFFSGTPILSHLLHPSLRELVMQFQQQASSAHKPKHILNSTNTTDSSIIATPPIVHKPTSASPPQITALTPPSMTPNTTDTSTEATPETTLNCLRCSMLPTTPRFADALQTNLRNHCCPHCIKQLDQELNIARIIPLHLAPGFYDSTKKNQQLLDSLDDTHVALLTLYKKTNTA